MDSRVFSVAAPEWVRPVTLALQTFVCVHPDAREHVKACALVYRCICKHAGSSLLKNELAHQEICVMAPKPKRCQICWNHRSSFRRQCIGCQLLVAPGCLPELCLFRDYSAERGLCRHCARRQLQVAVQLLAATLPSALDVVRDSGF